MVHARLKIIAKVYACFLSLQSISVYTGYDETKGMQEEEKRYEIRVHGRVQGVGFRYAAGKQARYLRLKGWVENQADGTVLSQVQGKPEACNAYIQWCRTGPGYSWVEKIDLLEKTPAPLSHFRIR